jgi:uncharacterized protein
VSRIETQVRTSGRILEPHNHFCSDHCQQRFSAAPARYTGPEQASSTQHGPATIEASPGTEAVDPVCGMTVDPATAAVHASHDGQE